MYTAKQALDDAHSANREMVVAAQARHGPQFACALTVAILQVTSLRNLARLATARLEHERVLLENTLRIAAQAEKSLLDSLPPLAMLNAAQREEMRSLVEKCVGRLQEAITRVGDGG